MLYGFDSTGGFYVIDHKLRRAAYAYPTSPLATLAKRNPERAAVNRAIEFDGRSNPVEDSHYEYLCGATGNTSV